MDKTLKNRIEDIFLTHLHCSMTGEKACKLLDVMRGKNQTLFAKTINDTDIELRGYFIDSVAHLVTNQSCGFILDIDGASKRCRCAIDRDVFRMLDGAVNGNFNTAEACRQLASLNGKIEFHVMCRAINNVDKDLRGKFLDLLLFNHVADELEVQITDQEEILAAEIRYIIKCAVDGDVTLINACKSLYGVKCESGSTLMVRTMREMDEAIVAPFIRLASDILDGDEYEKFKKWRQKENEVSKVQPAG